jgi:hypothetical protein
VDLLSPQPRVFVQAPVPMGLHAPLSRGSATGGCTRNMFNCSGEMDIIAALKSVAIIRLSGALRWVSVTLPLSLSSTY